MIEGSSFVPGKTVSNSFAKMNISDILKKNNNNDMKKNFKNNFICLKKISPLYNLFYLLFFALPIFSMNLPVPDNEVVSEPLPESYKKILMSESDVEKFIEDALQNNKQPVFFFGANWCPDCRILDGTLELPTIKNLSTKVLMLFNGNFVYKGTTNDFFYNCDEPFSVQFRNRRLAGPISV